ncbi:hypothetical protein Vadar_002176 [Vaccinium darrowii]|uniref:Uncharacterized protein n=1 Tax=Vaccinium darrowii TaxID=229202 RepID=A0ACB7Y4U2_9ERIC|nr:hypothetical protein Vadar_002176 [Vaccinium darrowii]
MPIPVKFLPILLFLANDVVGVSSPSFKSASFFYKTGLIWHDFCKFDQAINCLEKATDLTTRIDIAGTMSAWPPLPSRAAAQQPQRSYRAAGISHFIATRYKKYAQGDTSFTPVYNEARGKSISLVSCESLAKVEELFDDLTFCKGENIIPTHFVDSTVVVLDPISLDVYDHFKTAFETFKSKGKPTSEWWKEIC